MVKKNVTGDILYGVMGGYIGETARCTWCGSASCHTSQCGTLSPKQDDQSSPQSRQMCPSISTHIHTAFYQ